MFEDWLIPDWPAPTNVRALFTTRVGGCSQTPFDSLNLALHVGDDEAAVNRNRSLLSRAGVPERVQWLQQVHGIQVVEAGEEGWTLTADGCFTREPNVVCAVMTADCLPVLLCDQAGSQVSAVHAGWRGLADGVLRSAVSCFKEPENLLACLGPAIGQRHFEVGVEVLEAFYNSAVDEVHLGMIGAAFAPSRSRPLKYHADLALLARAELAALGVTRVYGGGYCTYADGSRFYSYRRDGDTGRMAALIWRQ